jgi:hypothetical protein
MQFIRINNILPIHNVVCFVGNFYDDLVCFSDYSIELVSQYILRFSCLIINNRAFNTVRKYLRDFVVNIYGRLVKFANFSNRVLSLH